MYKTNVFKFSFCTLIAWKHHITLIDLSLSRVTCPKPGMCMSSDRIKPFRELEEHRQWSYCSAKVIALLIASDMRYLSLLLQFSLESFVKLHQIVQWEGENRWEDFTVWVCLQTSRTNSFQCDLIQRSSSLWFRICWCLNKVIETKLFWRFWSMNPPWVDAHVLFKSMTACTSF